MTRDVEGAKKLLAEAGHPDGIEVELHCKKDPDWEPQRLPGHGRAVEAKPASR